MGAAAFGRVMGLGGLLMAPFAVAAPALGARFRDQTGSYDLTLLGFAAGMGAAALLLTRLREHDGVSQAESSTLPSSS